MALLAPAGPVTEARVQSAIDRCISLGLEAVEGLSARSRLGYLAGTDGARARDFVDALRDPAIDAIWALRGGYGTMRLLSSLDVRTLRENAKAFIGFSDNTALHRAYDAAGVVSFHGPHAGATLPPFAEDLLRRVLFEPCAAGELPLPPGVARPVTLVAGTGAGALAGGNLTLLAATCGTPWALRAAGRIVVFEDVGEATYRIDRAIVQLILAGALDGAAGLVFGQFTERPESAHDREVEAVVAELVAPLGVPAVLGAPIGHRDDQWTIPLGARARLDADRGTLEILEPAVA